jgi:hypothetical protein
VAETASVLHAALAIAAGAADPPRRLSVRDPVAIASIERPATDVPAESTRHEPARDSRWLWLAAGIGLAVEQGLRRRYDATRAAARRAAAAEAEAVG